jgi:hypothetical protein
MPESSGVIRPSGRTAVASIIERPGPREIIPPRWAKCQGVWWPFWAEYWHRGLSRMRFWRVRPRMVRGVNTLGIGFPFGCGSEAVPLGGSCKGVK